ncbi:DUF1802 family protein [Paenibacillus sp. P96]|uniref:DUF1802 family protein n=1 Tax=Paenibacillus zeirhizosphaerae TaxID=2987519 RepID=A0ABT9FT88_9BACL|nr:DUF1802 family protein [Paenibacillus sp. P96]MDP4097935.1 DUF1802 family protein [Paenibacillus sp. P96]
MNESVVALKEWASAIGAMENGRQIMLMRKGGIAEETRHFQLKSHAFYLYPTYEHQRRELVKEADRQRIDDSLDHWHPANTTVQIRIYAEAVEDIEVHDQDMLNLLREYHMWTDDFAAERLKWKRKDPLHILLLRVYKLKQPMEIDIRSEYLGCRSWISMETHSMPSEMTPVLEDREFEAQVREIKKVLKV